MKGKTAPPENLGGKVTLNAVRGTGVGRRSLDQKASETGAGRPRISGGGGGEKWGNLKMRKVGVKHGPSRQGTSTMKGPG